MGPLAMPWVLLCAFIAVALQLSAVEYFVCTRTRTSPTHVVWRVEAISFATQNCGRLAEKAAIGTPTDFVFTLLWGVITAINALAHGDAIRWSPCRAACRD